MSAAIDITCQPVHYRQFDPDQPQTPAEAWRDGDAAASTAFAEWLASDEQRQALEELISLHSDDETVQALVEQWAKEAA
ncbi:hypothetical protein HPA02_34920 [Bisbaumannia pacifica]|uniref:Uncharacterized protein n=1 Tax=Bisbaumannia pacifica TaxID=77098 RepID=A0A510XCP0_9GAMM|nr:hypothetical protein [Halomonas pacifica]GEK49209.1 hypothetical protein HPA02_34920 [Halomonas pacifica]